MTRPGERDPRIGRPGRSGTLAALLLALVGLAAVLPLVAGGLVLLWNLAARSTDRSMTSTLLRRHQYGARRSDVPVAVLAGPWHLLGAAVATVVALLLPAVVALGTMLSTAFALSASHLGLADRPANSLTVAAGAGAGVLTAWWGPGSASLRRGSRSLVRGVVREGSARAVVVALCLLAFAGSAAQAALRHGIPDWRPLQSGPAWLGSAVAIRQPVDLPAAAAAAVLDAAGAEGSQGSAGAPGQ